MRLMKENIMYLNVAKVVEHVGEMSDQLDNHVKVNTVSLFPVFVSFFSFGERQSERESGESDFFLIFLFFLFFFFCFSNLSASDNFTKNFTTATKNGGKNEFDCFKSNRRQG